MPREEEPLRRTSFEWQSPEEQYPVYRNVCETFHKENNWKCLILTAILFTCLGIITWCRCTQVTKFVIKLSKIPVKTGRTTSICDEGIIIISTVFMGMFYIVYLIECWFCNTRLEFKSRLSVDEVKGKVRQMRESQPVVWWKAICYHYVRRKRLTRRLDRNIRSSQQVYYERINTHSAESTFSFALCGVKDISGTLVLDKRNSAITKITFSKGFAFANLESAIEFEEQRTNFFVNQEFFDDYMEMREGLDIMGWKEIFIAHPDIVPWYACETAFWVASLLLLSWPMRFLMNYNTAVVHYKITKLFGMNYESILSSQSTPIYPLPLSISEGTMDSRELEEVVQENTTLIPSYSEALLIDENQPNHSFSSNSLRRDSDWTIRSRGSSRRIYQSRPLPSTCPHDPIEEPPNYAEALKFPVVNYQSIRRSLTENMNFNTTLINSNDNNQQNRPRTIISMETSL